MHPKTITPPKIPGAVKLTPLQLNAIRLNVKHTVLTPADLEGNSQPENADPIK